MNKLYFYKIYNKRRVLMKLQKSFYIILIILIVISSVISCLGSNSLKGNISNEDICRVVSKKPLEIIADLNGDGIDEKIVFELCWEDESIHSMSILKIYIYNKKNLVYKYNLSSRKKVDYSGDYFIQKYRYISSVAMDTYRDLIFIYAGCCPPELYILYCQPKQYTEGHKMIENEKYDVLDTGIQLEEFQG